MATQPDASALLARLLDGGHSVIAGRIAGAFRNIGREREADAILSTMRAAGYDAREKDPFDVRLTHMPYRREPSPYVHRIRLMWQAMRPEIPQRFPFPLGRPNDIEAYLRAVDDIYVTDAYHSLSIEGYTVSRELIERVRRGDWNPQENEADKKHRDAMAARGYWQAFIAVKDSVRKVLTGKSPGAVADHDHGTWYRELFAPSVAAGLVKAANLAGYRNSPVYIRRSRHVPLRADAVRDAMPTFFELLTDEPDPAVRVVLGHFIFVYIHPYLDGNGRAGQFLMNVMMAAGGYPWTVIPVQARDRYVAALEIAERQSRHRTIHDILGGTCGAAGARTPTIPPAAANVVEQLFSDFKTHAEARYARRERAAQVVVREILDPAFVERFLACAEAVEGSSGVTPCREKKRREARCFVNDTAGHRAERDFRYTRILRDLAGESDRSISYPFPA